MSCWFLCVLCSVPCLGTRCSQAKTQECFSGPERSSSDVPSGDRNGNSTPSNNSLQLFCLCYPRKWVHIFLDSLLTSFCLSFGVAQTWLKEIMCFSPFHPSNQGIIFWHLIAAKLHTRHCGKHSKLDRRATRTHRCHEGDPGRSAFGGVTSTSNT